MSLWTGSVVTGRFVTRQVNNLLRITLENGTVFTGTTTHPVWLADKHSWVTLEEIQPGDILDGVSGPLAVSQVVPEPVVSDVYNIEVHGHHVYRITDDGILVHNNYPVGNGSSSVRYSDAPFTGYGAFGRGTPPNSISTGRTVANSIKEKLAMEQVVTKPGGMQLPIKMSDTKNNLLAQDGWVKMAQNVNGVEIHYVKNLKTGQILDFKFKN